MLICLLRDMFQATIYCIDYLHSRVNLILTCFFVFDYNISYYNTLKMKKELFVFVLLSFFITLINLGTQTRFTIVFNQPQECEICLLDLSYSLWIAWKCSGKMVCLAYFCPMSQLVTFFHFNAVFWFYENRVINLLSKTLDRLLCECASGIIWVRVPKFSPFSEQY